MAMSECIKGLLAEGAISKGQGEKAEQLYSRHFNRLKHGKGMMAAAAEASELTLKHLRGEALAAKRAKLSTAMAQVRALEDMASYNGGRRTKEGLLDPRAASALTTWDDRARYMDLEAQQEALRATYHATLDGLLRESRATVLGRVRDPALEDDILAAAYGEKVDSVNAMEYAQAAQKVAELARQQFNEAGGHIAQREDWHWVQDHSGDRLLDAGFERWKAEVLGSDDRGVPILKASAMIDHETGAPFEPEAFDAVLRKMFKDVTTDGRASMEIGGGGQGKALYNRHAEERFFVFTDSRTHRWYAERYGKTGVVEGMMRHLDRMARDNAAMQRFGANPDATIRHIGDTLIQQAADQLGLEPRPARKWYDPRRLLGDAQDRAAAAADQLQSTYDVFMGRHQNMVPRFGRVAAGFDAFRSFQVSAKLGGATISAATGDMATQSVTRAFNGLPQLRMVDEYLRLMAPTDDSLAQRQMLIRHGALAADWAYSGAQVHRLMGEEAGSEVAKRMADTTLRLSALSKHTDVQRQMFVKSFNAGIADEIGKAHGELPPKLADALDRYGIGAAEWEALRATPMEEAHGTMWFNPMAIEDTALRDRYLRMVHTEKRFAVPEVDLRTRAMLTENFKRGTWFGETMKSLFLFKTFGLTIVNTHGRRALGRSGWAGARFFAAYATRMGVLASLAGAVAIQLQNLLAGRDTEEMATPQFVGKAIAQGGGFGIFGDFLKSSENRFGGSLATTLGGPGVQTVQNVLDLTAGNAMKAARGDELDVGRDIVRIMRQEVPVASSLWYVRPIYNRLLLEELSAMVNPDHEADQAALIRKAENEGRPFYAPPGSGPNSWRAPDWGNAVGAPQAPENVAREAMEQAEAGL